MMLNVFDRYARFAMQWPKLCLFLALVLTLFFAFLGRDVRLNNHFSSLFAIDNDANAYRHFYREQFGADDAVLVALMKPATVDQTFFSKLQHITESLEQSPYFVRIFSPVSTSVIWSDADTVYVDPVYDAKSPMAVADMLKLMRESPATAGRVIAKDADVFAIMAQMPDDHDRFERIKPPADFFQKLVDESLKGHDVDVHYAGIAFTRIGILKLMMQDLVMLVPLTTLVVMAFSMYLFRRWITVWLSGLTSVFGVAATLGLMGLNNDDINQLTLTFPILLMVIIVANNVHFFHRYFREIELGHSVSEAVRITTQRIGIAALLSCFTTMIGFYTLMTADMLILRSFGFYLGTGVLVSFVGMMLIIPPCLLLFAPKPKTIKHSDEADWLDNSIAAIISPKWRSKVCVAGAVFLLVSSYIAAGASYDYVLSDMLDADHPQAIAGKEMDKYLSGALPLEISILGEAGQFNNPQNLLKIQKLTTWLSERTAITNWLSLSEVVSALNHAIDGSKAIPLQDGAVDQLLLLAEGSTDSIVRQLVNEDYSHTRIKGNIPDIGAANLIQLQRDFEAYAVDVMQGTGITVRMTGEIPVAYEGMNQLTHELMNSVILALFFVVLTIFLVFRDWRLTLGSIFPNILPIVLGLGAYALTGQALNPLPGIAFCIGIGIAVDDTVHLFARFNEEKAKGKSRVQAITDAVHEIKGALIVTSVILTAGFLIFLLSGFTWNRELGMLGAMLIIWALLADLIFTPAILSFGKDNHTCGMKADE